MPKFPKKFKKVIIKFLSKNEEKFIIQLLASKAKVYPLGENQILCLLIFVSEQAQQMSTHLRFFDRPMPHTGRKNILGTHPKPC